MLAGVDFRETDLSEYIQALAGNITCVQGVFQKGPIEVATKVNGWAQFYSIYGGYLDGYDAPLHVRRALDRGATLYISRVAHYTAIADASTLTAIAASVTLSDRNGAPAPTLKVSASSRGTWGNQAIGGLSVEVKDATLNPATEFRLDVKLNGKIVEVHDNLSMDSTKSNYAEVVVAAQSQYIVADDQDSVTAVFADRPALGMFNLVGGNDGLANLSDTDYIGDAGAATGMHVFDNVTDATQMAALEATAGGGVPATSAVVIAGVAYCEARKDMLFIAEVPDGTVASAVIFRGAIDSSYGAMYRGRLYVQDPKKPLQKLMGALGDILGVYAYNDKVAKMWYPPAGDKRGRIPYALGLKDNVGTAAREAGDGATLYDNSINPILKRNESGIMVWGNRTLLRSSSSALRSIHVRRLLLYCEKGIAGAMWKYNFDLHDPQTWREVYNAVTEFMDPVKSGRGCYDYRFECDQTAKSIDDVKLNTPQNIDNEVFVSQLFIKPVRSIERVQVDFIVTKTGAVLTETTLPA